MTDYTEEVTTTLSKFRIGHVTKHIRPSARRSGKKRRRRPIVESKLIYERLAKGRRVMEIQVADREKGWWQQKVFEEDENGLWRLIHEDDGPLAAKKGPKKR